MPTRAFRDRIVLMAFREAAMEDIGLLTRLHNRSLDAATLDMMEEGGFPNSFGVRLRSAAGRAALVRMEAAMAGLASDEEHLRRLAADYATIYLSPDRLDERGRLRRAGDDLVAHLTGVGQMISSGGLPGLSAATVYLDHSLIGRVDPFVAWVSALAQDPFYAALAHLTAAYVRELRDLLRQIVEEPRRVLSVGQGERMAGP